MHKISAVTIINRQDGKHLWLQGAEIKIRNTLSSFAFTLHTCGTVPKVVDSREHTFICGDVEGRYVTVTIPKLWQILSLCEVQVFASPTVPEVITPSLPTPPPPPSVGKLLGGRNVMVVGERLCWSDALFFCRRHHWDLLRLRSLEEQREVEQLLITSPFPLTHHVWLGLRRYIMGDRWFWMSGESMKFKHWRRDTAPHRYASSCGGMAGGEPYLWGDRPCGEHLNFICQSGAEVGAQRVQFYSFNKATSQAT
ncbi:macrophage mannose receptor 1-like [Centropristis striata]|uniref:macrophage mannose receptor 1-like n=1 Tax=Centropristis striata TaxID=184440 RepID=UPI0027E10B04|nr:macrophage mannose receptor 1-like [Centropristis striata]